MIKLAIYGVLFLAISAAIYGAKRSYDNGIREDERAKYAALIDKCTESNREPVECAKEWTDAVAFNVSLQRDLVGLRNASQSCSTETQRGSDLTAQAEAEKARLLARTEGYRAGLKQSNSQLEARLVAVSTGSRTCEQTLRSVATALRGIAEQRIKFALGFEDQPAGAGSMRVK